MVFTMVLFHSFISLYLTDLEEAFSVNQGTLAEKAQEVEELEKEAAAILQELSQRVTVYSTCL